MFTFTTPAALEDAWLTHVCSGERYASSISDSVRDATTFMFLCLSAASFIFYCVFHALRYRCKIDADETEMRVRDALVDIREEQASHQTVVDALRTDLNEVLDIEREAELALRLLKTKCARRVAFVRHVRAVNMRYQGQIDNLRLSITEKIEALEQQDQQDDLSPEQFKCEDEEAKEPQVHPQAFDAPRDQSPEPQVPTVNTGAPRTTSAEHAANYRASQSTCPPRSPTRRSAMAEELCEELDAAYIGMISTVRTRDLRLQHLKELEDEQVDLVEKLRYVWNESDRFETHAQSTLETIQMMKDENRALRQEVALSPLRQELKAEMEQNEQAFDIIADNDSDTENLVALACERPDLYEVPEFVDVEFPLVLRDTVQDDEDDEPVDVDLVFESKQVFLDYLFEQHGISFDPFSETAPQRMEDLIEELEQSNDILTRAVERGWQEMDGLNEFALEQEEAIEEMMRIAIDDQVERDEQAALAVVEDRNEATADLGQNAIQAPLEPVQGASIMEESQWLAAFVDRAQEQLANAEAELANAREVTERCVLAQIEEEEDKETSSNPNFEVSESELPDIHSTGKKRLPIAEVDVNVGIRPAVCKHADVNFSSPMGSACSDHSKQRKVFGTVPKAHHSTNRFSPPPGTTLAKLASPQHTVFRDKENAF